jgi:alginate O-acetyltransferase complex protein AlgJ
VPPAWQRSDFDESRQTVTAMDLAAMIGLKRVLSEEDFRLVPRRPRRAVVVDPRDADPTAQLGELVMEISGSSLPRAVIFRDSFASKLVPFLSEHFSRAVYLWQNDFLPAAIEREHADVVIQEIVGRHLYSFVPSPELVPE